MASLKLQTLNPFIAIIGTDSEDSDARALHLALFAAAQNGHAGVLQLLLQWLGEVLRSGRYLRHFLRLDGSGKANPWVAAAAWDHPEALGELLGVEFDGENIRNLVAKSVAITALQTESRKVIRNLLQRDNISRERFWRRNLMSGLRKINAGDGSCFDEETLGSILESFAEASSSEPTA